MPSRVDSQSDRLLAYLAHNRSRLLVDVVSLSAWTSLAVTLFVFMNYPRWLLYLVVMFGVVVYTRITPTWEPPDGSPDQEPR